MSLPHFRGPVIRRERISIRYRDPFNEVKHIAAKGYLARVLLHELDHLDGVLYVDRMNDEASLEPSDIFRS
jgi:peptide deformylase